MNRIDSAIKAAEGAVDAVTSRHSDIPWLDATEQQREAAMQKARAALNLPVARQQGFTPGPWNVTQGLYGRPKDYTIWGAAEVNECGHKVYDFVATLGNQQGKDEANAMLISAAPQLLWALERGLTLINEHADELAGFEHPDIINGVVDEMRAAINKAKGGL